jgi:hypothetical protein
MTRRTLFQALAGLPVVGRLVAASYAADYAASLRRSLAAEREIWVGGPVTHYVGFDTGRSDVNVAAPHRSHQTIAEALEYVVAGRGDTIVVAPGHEERLPAALSRPLSGLYSNHRLPIL